MRTQTKKRVLASAISIVLALGMNPAFGIAEESANPSSPKTEAAQTVKTNKTTDKAEKDKKANAKASSKKSQKQTEAEAKAAEKAANEAKPNETEKQTEAKKEAETKTETNVSATATTDNAETKTPATSSTPAASAEPSATDAKTDEPAERNLFAVWISDNEQHPNTGGGFVIEYVSEDGSIPADSGKYWDSSTNQAVPMGTKVTLTAKPSEGYVFDGWYQGNIDKDAETDPHYFPNKLVASEAKYSFTGNPVGENESAVICAVFRKGEPTPTPTHVHTLVKTEEVAATCTKEGTVAYWTCSTCGKIFLDADAKQEVTDKTKLVIPALGHNWGEWVTVTEPTEEAEGLRRHTCSRCNLVEDEAIPKLKAEYTLVSGDGATFTQGSGASLTFKYKRSINPNTAASHFAGVQVDGKAIQNASYAVADDGVTITLKAAYLQTLSTGAHKFTALYNDGTAPSASFTVKAKSATNNQKKTSNTTTSKTNTAKTNKSVPKVGDPTIGVTAVVSAGLALCGSGIVYRRRKQ